MTGVGLESTVLPIFLVAMALILAYSAAFVWLNRDRRVLSILGASTWSLGALIVLVVTSPDSADYWAVALAVVVTILALGTLTSRLRRRALKVRVGAVSHREA